MSRDRNEHGQYADAIDPDTVGEVFDARDDVARPVTASDVVDELDIARRTAHNKLNALVERGELETRKIGARGRVWWRPLPRDEHETRETAAHGDADGFDAADLHGDASTTLDDDTGARAGGSDVGDAGRVTLPDDVPSGVDDNAARNAIDAAREFVRTDGPASAREIVAAVMPAHTLGYDVPELEPGDRYRGAWWRRIIKPGLGGLDDVVYRENHQDYAHVADVDHD